MPAEREDSKSLVDEKEVEEGRRRRRRKKKKKKKKYWRRCERKKFRDTVNEWRAPPANERKTLSFFARRELKLSRSSFTTTEALPTDHGTDVALRQQCNCLSLAVLSIPRTTPASSSRQATTTRACAARQPLQRRCSSGSDGRKKT
jgi:hypothetical protein